VISAQQGKLQESEPFSQVYNVFKPAFGDKVGKGVQIGRAVIVTVGTGVAVSVGTGMTVAVNVEGGNSFTVGSAPGVGWETQLVKKNKSTSKMFFLMIYRPLILL
jgi:hypothetical protein